MTTISFHFEEPEDAIKFHKSLYAAEPDSDFARSGTFHSSIKANEVTLDAMGEEPWRYNLCMSAAAHAEDLNPNCCTVIHSDVDDDHEPVSMALACTAAGVQNIHFAPDEQPFAPKEQPFGRRLDFESACSSIQASLHEVSPEQYPASTSSAHDLQLLQRSFKKHRKTGLGFWGHFKENHPKVAQGLKATGLMLGAAVLIAASIAIGVFTAGTVPLAAAIVIAAVSSVVLGHNAEKLAKKAIKEIKPEPADPKPAKKNKKK